MRADMTLTQTYMRFGRKYKYANKHAGEAQRFGIWSKSDQTMPLKRIVFQRWKRDDKRESKCVHRKKAKRLQKSNSLTSVWDAVVASEGQRRKINTSWFAEGGRVGGGGGEPERWEKRPTAQIKIKRNPDYTEEEGKMFLYVGFTHWCPSERVIHWRGRRVFLGLPGGGAYLSGRADSERAARERCEEADESCPASPRRENAWEDDRDENWRREKKKDNRGFIDLFYVVNKYCKKIKYYFCSSWH